jgi:dimethylamine monooxygenase subunit C
MSQLCFVPNKRKYILIGNVDGIQLLTPILEEIKDSNLHYEVINLNATIQEGSDYHLFQVSPILNRLLCQQKMGTFVYAALPWDAISYYKLFFEKAGFSDEEYQCIGFGERRIRVFCCRCHGISEVLHGEQEVTCQHCQLHLEITSHYSKLKDAYLGFLAKL